MVVVGRGKSEWRIGGRWFRKTNENGARQTRSNFLRAIETRASYPKDEERKFAKKIAEKYSRSKRREDREKLLKTLLLSSKPARVVQKCARVLNLFSCVFVFVKGKSDPSHVSSTYLRERFFYFFLSHSLSFLFSMALAFSALFSLSEFFFPSVSIT